MFELPINPNRHHITRTLTHAVWPLPTLDGRAPVIVNASNEAVRLGYERLHPRDCVVQCAPGTSTGNDTHFMPRHLPAFAVRAGKIAYSGKHADGYAVLLDHEDGWATYYANLETMFAIPTSQRQARAECVRRGDALGHVGATADGKLSCLHFELWQLEDDAHYQRVDPTLHLDSWSQLPWIDGRYQPRSHREAA